MTYRTIEAVLEKNTISFKENVLLPTKKIKVLVTFVENEDDFNLYELPENEITDEIKDMSKKSLKKNKKLFINI